MRSHGRESTEFIRIMFVMPPPPLDREESALVRLSRCSRVICTSRVTTIPAQPSLMMGQYTGSDAQIVARCTSSADSTMAGAAYQLGSNVGQVPARVSARVTRRQTEQMLTLGKDQWGER